MPRVARQSLGTSFFHIVVQGINKEYIFNNEQQIKLYLALLERYREKYKEVKMLAYCIMNNHAHMLIYCEEIIKMAQYMKCVNTSYAMQYNKYKKRKGYVFRDRYLSEPIYKEEYLYNCIGYIHRNPVEAKMVEHERDYKYSSYNDYINKQGIVTSEILKLIFGTEKDYLKNFLIGTQGESEFIDLVIEQEEPEKLITIYCNKAKAELKEIIGNEEQLKGLVEYMVVDNGVSLRSMSRILAISRFKMSRLLKLD